MKNLLLAISVASMALGATGQTFAADMPVKAPRVAYDACGIPRFAGFYVGGNAGAVGYHANRNDLDGYFVDNTGWDSTAINVTAGIQAGYDWQFCNKVIGVVADWNWSNAKASTVSNPNATPETVDGQMRWFSTLRARAGVTVNDALFYVTGGVAAANIKSTIQGNSADPLTFSQTRWGGVGGVGAEFALGGNWSLNTEVLYLRFAKQNVNFTDSGGNTGGFDFNDSAWVTRLGLNYRFGGANSANAAYAYAGKMAPNPCGVSRFGGGYVGGNAGAVGYSANRNDLDGQLTDNSGWTSTNISATAGVQAGYDWQSCNKVFGVVADWNWTNAQNTTLDNPNGGGTNRIESKMNWFGTVRGRAGLAVNDTLVYLTGGLAAANIKTSIADGNGESLFSKTRWGLVGGAGAEFSLGNNWSLNTEILYMQFTKQTETLVSGGTTYTHDFNDSAWVTRLGLNYRFGGPNMPAKAAMNPCGASRFKGGYVGGNIGAAGYSANRNDLDGFLTDNSGWTATTGAMTAGVQAGYDWQACNKVFGVVADLNWTNAKATTVDEPNSPPSNSFESQMRWYGTLRGRAGLAVNDTLLYLTGGMAAAGIKTTITDPPDTFSTSKVRWGVVGGAGAEFLLGNNWSLNTEVLYMQFAKQSESFTNGGGTTFAFDLNDSVWVGKVGLNYRWGNAGPI